jgi:hypothetical protein
MGRTALQVLLRVWLRLRGATWQPVPTRPPQQSAVSRDAGEAQGDEARERGGAEGDPQK